MALLVRLERVSEGLFAAFVAETGQRVTLGPAQDVQELADLCSFKLALDRGLNMSGVSFWSPSALEELSQDAEALRAVPWPQFLQSLAMPLVPAAGAEGPAGAPGPPVQAADVAAAVAGEGPAVAPAPEPAPGSAPATSDLIIPDSEEEDLAVHGSSQSSPAGGLWPPLAAPAPETLLRQQEKPQAQKLEGQPAQLAVIRAPSAGAGAASAGAASTSTGAAAGASTHQRWQVLPGGGGVQKVLPKGGKGMLHLNLSESAWLALFGSTEPHPRLLLRHAASGRSFPVEVAYLAGKGYRFGTGYTAVARHLRLEGGDTIVLKRAEGGAARSAPVLAVSVVRASSSGGGTGGSHTSGAVPAAAAVTAAAAAAAAGSAGGSPSAVDDRRKRAAEAAGLLRSPGGTIKQQRVDSFFPSASRKAGQLLAQPPQLPAGLLEPAVLQQLTGKQKQLPGLLQLMGQQEGLQMGLQQVLGQRQMELLGQEQGQQPLPLQSNQWLEEGRQQEQEQQQQEQRQQPQKHQPPLAMGQDGTDAASPQGTPAASSCLPGSTASPLCRASAGACAAAAGTVDAQLRAPPQEQHSGAEQAAAPAAAPAAVPALVAGVATPVDATAPDLNPFQMYGQMKGAVAASGLPADQRHAYAQRFMRLPAWQQQFHFAEVLEMHSEMQQEQGEAGLAMAAQLRRFLEQEAALGQGGSGVGGPAGALTTSGGCSGQPGGCGGGGGAGGSTCH